MVICDNKHYGSFEELGYAILASLPKERQPVKWWRGWSVTFCHHENWMTKTLWQRIRVWLPHFSKSRSWVGYFWLDAFLFNRWDVMFTCGDYKFEEESDGTARQVESKQAPNRARTEAAARRVQGAKVLFG